MLAEFAPTRPIRLHIASAFERIQSGRGPLASIPAPLKDFPANLPSPAEAFRGGPGKEISPGPFG
jgi:hypothetical protein